MGKNIKCKLLSSILCIVFLIVHFHAITVSAAPLGNENSKEIIDAIQSTEQGNEKKLYSNLTGGSTVYIRSFEITNVDAPVTGQLLDGTATVVADNGVTWDIPVIWVDKDGDIVHLAVEIDDVIRSYPIFVFYMPEDYSFIFGENAAYNIGMPDFVADLMKRNGITALSIPEAGRTYISALLPNTDRFKIKITPPDNENELSGSNDSSSKDIDPNPGHSSGGASGPNSTPPTDNDTTPPDPGLSDDEKQQITNAHCNQNAIDTLGVDKLAALVTWVKYTLEPEATNLLVNKFPAYKNAASNNELGDNIGLYIYYDTGDGAMAYVSTSSSNGDVSYRVGINASSFYEYDPSIGDYVFDGDTNYSDLDNSLVHEMMHAFMEDYCRTGMEGYQHNTTTDQYRSDSGNNEIEFPLWFIEGTASSVDNTFQYRYNTIHRLYGYDNDPNSDTYNTFVASDLKDSYSNRSSDIQITGTSTPSNYISGYLATVYLSYLAAKKNGKEAVSGDRVDSSIVLYGENYILEQLHSGKTLDAVISDVSNSMYSSTEDFENNFILDVDGTDGGQSLEFCTKLLNYLQQSTSDDSIANGSILLDFSDTNNAQLHKYLLNQTQTVYVPTDTKDYAASTVNKDDALQSGGTTVPGTVSKATDEQIVPLFEEQLVAKEPDNEETSNENNVSSSNETTDDHDNTENPHLTDESATIATLVESISQEETEIRSNDLGEANGTDISTNTFESEDELVHYENENLTVSESTPAPSEIIVLEEMNEPVGNNPIIISETSSEEESDENDDSNSEQVLDVMPEDSNRDEEKIDKELLTK